MKQPVRYVLRILLRLLIVWVVDAIAMLITIGLVPSVTVTGASLIGAAAAAALLLAVINLFLRPIILLLALPLGFFAMFAAGFVVNAIAFLILGRLIPSLDVGLCRRFSLCGDQHDHHERDHGGR